MAWNLGSRMTAVEISHTALKRGNATNTATKEPPSNTDGKTEDSTMAILISSIQPTKVPQTQSQPITLIITHSESSQACLRIDKGKGIATESDEDLSKKLVPASTIIRPNLDEEVKVPCMINGKMYYLTDREMQACGSLDLNISLSLNKYKGLTTIDKSKTTMTETLLENLESMWNLNSKQ
nr:hypothetical protein [Tanacetum cinerariifolium]